MIKISLWPVDFVKERLKHKIICQNFYFITVWL